MLQAQLVKLARPPLHLHAGMSVSSLAQLTSTRPRNSRYAAYSPFQ